MTKNPGTDLDLSITAHIGWMRLCGCSGTYTYCRKTLLRQVTRFIGKPLTRATPKDLMRWRESLTATVLPDTIVAYVTHLREFYNWAVTSKLTRSNPAQGLPVPRRVIRVPRPIAEQHLATALSTAPRDVRLILVLSGWLGLRSCEIAGLRWESIRLDGPAPLIIVAWDTAKGRKERVLPLTNPWVIAEFRRYGVKSCGLVFRRRDGQPGPNRPYRIGQLAGVHLQENGIDATLHQGRHRYATAMLASCHDLRVVQEMLGHASPATTAIYTAYDQVTAAAAMAALPVPAAA